MDFLNDFLAGVDTSGIENIILAIFKWISEFDVKTVDTSIVQKLLDTFYPIWNPFWAWVNELLGAYFGF